VHFVGLKNVWSNVSTVNVSWPLSATFHTHITNCFQVYGQVTLTFRYGREDEEVMGLKFCNEAVMCLAQLYPPHERAGPQSSTPLQVRSCSRAVLARKQHTATGKVMQSSGPAHKQHTATGKVMSSVEWAAVCVALVSRWVSQPTACDLTRLSIKQVEPAV
jgi:hypothetical protein